tara:strand:+ start:257 stop:1069 length:813 start_codon:yes stop_codon:yes gene_type:complete
MKLIRKNSDLNKAISNTKELGFVPTMGSLHKGHEFLIKVSKRKCKKTLVSIFVNPTQFNDKNDYQNYPRDLNKDLKILKRLKVDFVYLPTINQIYKEKSLSKINLKKSQKILCAKFRKGHFEGVLDIMERFIKLIKPKYIFMGEKDYQQLFLVKDFIKDKHRSKIYPCKTIRDKNKVALSSRNYLLSKKDFNKAGLIAAFLQKLKFTIKIDRSVNSYLNVLKTELIKKYKIKIEYLEIRNEKDLKLTVVNKKNRLFIAYYINKVRLIDNF